MAILHYVLTMVQLLLNTWFASTFFSRRRDVSKWAGIYLFFAPVAAILTGSLGYGWLNMLISLVVTFLFFIPVFESRLRNKFIASVAIFVINVFCELITLYIASILVKESAASVIEQYLTEAIYSAISTTWFFLITWLVKAIVKKRRTDDSDIYFNSHIRSIMLPLSGIIVGYYVLFASQSHNDIYFSAFGVLVFVCLLASIVANMFGSENDYKKFTLHKDMAAMQLNAEMTTELVQIQQNSINSLKEQAHDFKNHLICVQELTKTSGKLLDEKTDAYLTQLMDDLDKTIITAYSGIKNDALRVIVSKTAEKYADSEIRFSTNVQYSDFSFMTYKDICSLFSNALDNAVYACEQIQAVEMEKNVDLSIFIHEQTIQIKLENSKSNPIYAHGSKLISTKSQASEHGFGTKNIERIVKAYEGDISVKHTDNQFALYINLPLPQ